MVRDRNGQQLAYVYFEDEPGRRSAANQNCCGVWLTSNAPFEWTLS